MEIITSDQLWGFLVALVPEQQAELQSLRDTCIMVKGDIAFSRLFLRDYLDGSGAAPDAELTAICEVVSATENTSFTVRQLRAHPWFRDTVTELRQLLRSSSGDAPLSPANNSVISNMWKLALQHQQQGRPRPADEHNRAEQEERIVFSIDNLLAAVRNMHERIAKTLATLHARVTNRDLSILIDSPSQNADAIDDLERAMQFMQSEHGSTDVLSDAEVGQFVEDFASMSPARTLGMAARERLKNYLLMRQRVLTWRDVLRVCRQCEALANAVQPSATGASPAGSAAVTEAETACARALLALRNGETSLDLRHAVSIRSCNVFFCSCAPHCRLRSTVLVSPSLISVRSRLCSICPWWPRSLWKGASG